jgi:hypothetical protein
MSLAECNKTYLLFDYQQSNNQKIVRNILKLKKSLFEVFINPNKSNF